MKGKRVQKYSLAAAIVLCIPIILCLSSCKNFGIPDYELKITIEEGVEGTPEAGVYSYKDLTTIDYSYTPVNPDHTVEIIVNGSRWTSSEGVFTMYNNLDVLVRILDIRGTWIIQLTTIDPDTGVELEEIEFNITFSSDNLLFGNFTDDRGYEGTWDIDGITITITYTDWQDYVLIGSIDSMNGTWESNIEDKEGTWRAGR